MKKLTLLLLSCALVACQKPAPLTVETAQEKPAPQADHTQRLTNPTKPDTTEWHTMTNAEIIAETKKCTDAGLGSRGYTDSDYANRIVYIECDPSRDPIRP